MRSNALIAVFPLIALILLAVSSCTTVQGAKVSLMLSWIPQVEFSGFYLAQDSGLYRKEGLDVDIREGGFEEVELHNVASGKLDFALYDGESVLTEARKGIVVVAVAAIFQENPACFFSRKSSGIVAAKDLVGRRVGIKNAYYKKLLHSLLASAGVPAASVKQVRVRADEIRKFYDGEVDVWCGFIHDEAAHAVEKGIAINVIRPSDYGIDAFTNLIITSPSHIESRPALVEKFVGASILGWEAALRAPSDAVAATMKRAPSLDREFQANSFEALRNLVAPTGTRIGWIDEKRWYGQPFYRMNPGFRTKVFTNDFVERFYRGRAKQSSAQG